MVFDDDKDDAADEAQREEQPVERTEAADTARPEAPVEQASAEEEAPAPLGEDDREEREEEVKEVPVRAAPAPVPVLDEAAQAALDEARAKLPWYAVHTYSGYEMRAKMSLEERIRSHHLEPKFGSVLVPQETVVELVRGQKKTSTRKFFPGYMLVQCELDDDTWHLVAETPKITGFVGDSRNPSPLSREEVETLTKQMEGGANRPRPRVQFEEGDAVKVIDGPFAEFNGTVDEVKADKGKLRVLISIFGRNTPVELDFVQVEKA